MNKVNPEVRSASWGAHPEQASAHGRSWAVLNLTSFFKAIADFFANLFSCRSPKQSNATQLKKRITSAPTLETRKIWEELRNVNEAIDKMYQKKRQGKDIEGDLTFARTHLEGIENKLNENLGLKQTCENADYEIARLREQLSNL